MPKPLLIAPAGNMECARAAVANGADAVYFGLPRFNARMRADNFTEKQLPELINFLHRHNVRGFCTLNTLIFTDELADVERELVLLEESGVDAVIVQDLGVAWLARELGLRMEIHGSTQMTITSPEGVRFAERLGLSTVVIARETSLKELARFNARHSERSEKSQVGEEEIPRSAQDDKNRSVRIEVFVHGALCVAYSGQCLTSETLGQRSANRGECAQACRLPYQLVVDGALKELGDRRYLLSPQDLMAVREIPELIRLGVSGFKIEGRLKTPEYVAATCQVYRKAIDAALNDASCSGASVKRRINSENLRFTEAQLHPADSYKLEMVFSRGLYSGWLHGVNHQELVHARFGKKRGAFVGFVTRVARDHVEVDARCAVKAGDGVVFDTGGNTEHEQGGRLYEVRGNQLFFERGHINFLRIKTGDRVWKTSDPQLERALRKSFEGKIPLPKVKLDLVARGKAGEPMKVVGAIVMSRVEKEDLGTNAAATAAVTSAMPLQAAQKRPLTTEFLREQLGRLGKTKFELGELRNELQGEVILPVSELNRMRRELVEKISVAAVCDRRKKKEKLGGHRPPLQLGRLLSEVHGKRTTVTGKPQLSALCRTMEQVRVAVEENVAVIYADFEDIRRYEEAVACVRLRAAALADNNAPKLRRSAIFLATPRIQKAGEQGFFKIIEDFKPDGVLVRNLGALDYYRNRAARPTVAPCRLIGDYSLNVANPLTADLLMREGLERLTISYDLNAQQVLDLLRAAPPSWFELTIHQHMPMFHMEHCVFAAFLSNGTDHTNCGRPCDTHNLKLRDRVGVDHPIKADVGCRNTVFHARAQSGVEFWREFVSAGLRHFRVELLEEDAEQTRLILENYRQLLDGKIADASELARRLKAVSQLGVTSGTLTVLG